MSRKILIDCDPGMDYTAAFRLLERLEQLDVTTVTTSFGRDGQTGSAGNGEEMAALLGLEAVRGAKGPVIEGSRNLRPQRRETKQSENCCFEERHAWDVIYDDAVREKGNLEILTLGPLTNLAAALLKYEDLKDRIKSLTIMGGSAGIGDVTPFGETNVLLDPYAFQIVLQSGISRVVMFGRDAAEPLDSAGDDSIAKGEKSPEKGLAAGGKKSPGECPRVSFRQLHAAAAATAAAFPEMVNTEPYHVAVELGENGQYGRTVVDQRLHAADEKNVHVVRSLDRETWMRILAHMEDEGWIR